MKISKLFSARKEIKCDGHITKEVKEFGYLRSISFRRKVPKGNCGFCEKN